MQCRDPYQYALFLYKDSSLKGKICAQLIRDCRLLVPDHRHLSKRSRHLKSMRKGSKYAMAAWWLRKEVILFLSPSTSYMRAQWASRIVLIRHSKVKYSSGKLILQTVKYNAYSFSEVAELWCTKDMFLIYTYAHTYFPLYKFYEQRSLLSHYRVRNEWFFMQLSLLKRNDASVWARPEKNKSFNIGKFPAN